MGGGGGGSSKGLGSKALGSMLNPVGAITGGLGGSGKSGGSGRSGTAMLAPAAPTPPAAKSLAPDKTNFGAQPEMISPPTWMGLNSSMTPEQQRSRVATMALAGDNSAYRSDEASNYYKNVAQRSFTDPEGNIVEGAAPLPIESQYVQNVLGRQLSNDTTANFLTQLLSI